MTAGVLAPTAKEVQQIINLFHSEFNMTLPKRREERKSFLHFAFGKEREKSPTSLPKIGMSFYSKQSYSLQGI